jgi:hypothetical protein
VSHPTALENFYCGIFRQENGSAPPLVDLVIFFTILELLKGAVRGLRSETRIQDRSPDPRVRPCTGTVKRPDAAQQRTTDPASTSRFAFRTVQYAAAFKFSLAHW